MRCLKYCLLATLAASAPAWADWHEASTSHFVVYSDQNVESLRAYATKLERFDKAMRFLRRLPDEPVGRANRLTVYIVPSIAAVRRLYGGGDADIAGFYLPRAGESIAITPRSTGADNAKSGFAPETVLLHEYTHHFLAHHYPDGADPAWFTEGYAEVAATAKFEKDGAIGFGLPANHRAYGLLRTNNTLPIEQMLAASYTKLSNSQREALYGRGLPIISSSSRRVPASSTPI